MIDINELPFENLKLASDIEAKGFWEKVHTKADIHCIASKDIDSGEIYLFHDYPEFDNVQVFDKHDGMMYTIPERTGTLENGFRWWEKATLAGSKLIVHNARTYDEPIVHKVDPDTKIPYKAWHDTFNQSKRQWFERPTPRGCKGAHGLEPWGKRLGISKPPVTDWEEMDAYKLHRVIEDIHIQEGTYLKLEKERQTLHANFGIDMRSSVMIEDMYSTECHNQERNGALVDVEHYEKCVEELDIIIEDLTHEIEPQLPMTVKGASTKASRKEVAEALGFDPARVKDKYYQKKKDGEVVTVVEKPFSKPSVNFYRTVKQKMYSATNIEHGFSGKFKKKALLNAWVKENHPTTKLNKDWEVEVDVEETKYLNKNTCEYFGVEEDATDLICGPHTKVSFEPSRMTQHDKVKGKLIREGWHYAEEWNLATDVYGDYIKVDKDTEVRWPPKAAPEHQIVKLVKEGGLLVSSPKLSEEDYEQLPEGLGMKIANYNTYMHRRRFLSNFKDPENKGLMSFIDERGRIPCGVNNFATRSGRGSQRVWVNAPSESALYGEQIRKGLIAGKGNKIVGVDMKSAQLSIAAYYANNDKYYDAVASGREEDDEGNYLGESAHCFNARAFGLVSHADWAEAKLNQQHDLLKSIGLKRKKSKGGSFACLPVDNTTLLSKDYGWVSYDELTVGMEVLTYNRFTGKNEYAPIEAVHFFEDKEVIRMKNNEWQFDSTPDHRWLGLRRGGKDGVRQELEEFIMTKDIKSEFKIYNAAPAQVQNSSKISVDEAELLGWILGDGSVSWKPFSTATSSSGGNKRGVKCTITQTDRKYGKEIKDCINRLGYYPKGTTECVGGYKKGTDCANYTVNANNVRDLWLRCGWSFGQNQHQVDLTSLVLTFDTARLEALFKSFYLSEGHTDKNGGVHVANNRGRIFEGMMLCMYLLGFNLSTQLKGSKKYPDSTCTDLLVKKKSYTGSTKIKKTSLGVKDTFCITTRNSTFVARQEDKISITGNCIFGSGGEKMAVTLGIPKNQGNEKKDNFLREIGLDNVNKYLKEVVAADHKYKGGWFLPVAFGYWLWNNSHHKNLNTVVQGFEAVAQKLAVVRAAKEIEKAGLSGKAWKVLEIHDEMLYECKEEVTDQVGAIVCKSYTWAADQIYKWHVKHPETFSNYGGPKFPIDLDGGFKVGNNYYEVH